MAVQQMFGRVVNVVRRQDGDELTAAAAIGSTTLSVKDAGDFDETGGKILYGGDVYTYDAITEGAGRDDPDILHLTTPTLTAGAVGDRVEVFRDNDASGSVVVEYRAQILTDDMDPDDAPIDVEIHQGVLTRLPEGVRGGPVEAVSLLKIDDAEPKLWEIEGELVQDILADAAVAAADLAFDKAVEGLTAAQLAQAMIDGEVDIYYQTSAPWANGDATHDDDTGDIWVDTDAATDTAYRWLNRTWTLIGDASLVAALLQAQSAQTTADGKIRMLVRTYFPVQDGADGHFGYGDLLKRSDQDNKEYYWDGDSWEPLILGSAGIATLLIGKTLVAGASATSGERIVLRQDGSGGILEFFTGSVDENAAGYIDPGATGSGVSAQGFLRSHSPDMGYGYAGITLLSATSTFAPFVVLTGELQAWDGIDMQGSSCVNAATMSADDFYGTTHGTHSGSVNGGSISGSTGDFSGRVDAGGELHGNTLWSDTQPTDSSAANVFMGASGKLQKSTASSRRYKKNIKDADIDVDAVLAMRPRFFRYKKDYYDSDQVFAGFIAEELLELGLDKFVDFNEDGVPENVRYAYITVAQQAVLQRQQAQIDALTARLDALEAS